MDAQVAVAQDRIVTLPNVVSLARLCCIPLFLYLLFGRDNRAAAAWLLGALGMTDWVDGYLARHFGPGVRPGQGPRPGGRPAPAARAA